MTERTVGLIFNGVWSHYVFATAPKYRDLVELIYVHDLPHTDISRFGGLIVPFQSDHAALAHCRTQLYGFLASGARLAVFGDSGHWLDATWVDRPLDNHWWKTHPSTPPVAHTRFDHPLFAGLTPRQAGFHHHGVYLRVPPQAQVLQRSAQGEVITWQSQAYGGLLLASTMDPIVEHAVQQVGHLDHLVDQLLWWLGGVRPVATPLTLDPQVFGQVYRRTTSSPHPRLDTNREKFRPASATISPQ